MAFALYPPETGRSALDKKRHLLSGRARNATIEGRVERFALDDFGAAERGELPEKTSDEKVYFLLRWLETESTHRTWVTPDQSKDYPVAYCKNGSDWATLLWDVHAEHWIQNEGGLQFRINLAGRRQLQLLSKTVTTPTQEHGDYWSTYPEADLDALTKLIIRRRFDIDLGRSFAEASETSPVALLFVDIDHFKKINDEHGGHAAGDRVLGGVAEILRSAVGRRGLVYRYGGEEITVILPGFSESEAATVAERLRESVERVDWRLVPPRPVTVSIGVADVPDDKITSPALFCDHADQAMYSAKKNGRNRVALASTNRLRPPAP